MLPFSIESPAGVSTRPAIIVLVEDNPGDVFLIHEALKEQNIAAQWAHFSDGEAALAQLQDQEWAAGRALPDLFILDLNIPRANGFEVLSGIRSHPKLRAVPVAVLTSSHSPEDIARARSLGSDIYIQKPADLDEFLGTVGNAVRCTLENGRHSQAEAHPA